MAKPLDSKAGRYSRLIEHIFFDKKFGAYRKNKQKILFERAALVEAARELGIALPKNLGDVIYSIRYRQGMPKSIRDTQPKGKEWIIEGVGSAKYKFCLSRTSNIVPNSQLATIKIPDATPEIIVSFRQACITLAMWFILVVPDVQWIAKEVNSNAGLRGHSRHSFGPVIVGTQIRTAGARELSRERSFAEDTVCQLPGKREAEARVESGFAFRRREVARLC